MITLNEKQAEAVEIIKDPAVRGFTLLGEGGTGKTTSIMQAVKTFIEQGLRVILLAPTNKAVKQLQYSAKKNGLQVDSSTIHKALGLALLPTSENKYPARMGAGILSIYDVAIIDEGSMISKIALFDYLLPELNANNVKTIFMGDDMQLPPVREQRSEALSIYPSMTLTQVERFSADSGIAKLSTLLRSAIKEGRAMNVDIEELGVERIPQALFDKEVCKLFEDSNTDDTRVLAWTNARVNEINHKIRLHIYGKDAPVYVVGEKVVMGSPIYDEFGQPVMSADEEATVTAVTESFVTSPESNKDYPVWVVAVTPDDSPNTTVFCNVLKASAYDNLQEELTIYRKKALDTGNSYWWKKFHDTKDLFADVKYCYCITVHRSQGSTFKTVAVDVANILKNYTKDERRKLLYVAVSRASERLIVNQRKVNL
jgi:ATP-dependent exoDNAse (exonuclease V) alpha subunit